MYKNDWNIFSNWQLLYWQGVTTVKNAVDEVNKFLKT